MDASTAITKVKSDGFTNRLRTECAITLYQIGELIKQVEESKIDDRDFIHEVVNEAKSLIGIANKIAQEEAEKEIANLQTTSTDALERAEEDNVSK